MKIEQRSEENMNVDDDDELEVALSEIPYATSSFILEKILKDDHHDHDNLVDHGYDHASFETQNMNGYGRGRGRVHDMYDDECLKHRYARASAPVGRLSCNGPPRLFSGAGHSSLDIGLQSHLISGNGFCLDFQKANETNGVDSFNSSKDFSKMYISDEQVGFSISRNGIQYCEQSVNGAPGMSFEKHGAYDYYGKGFKDSRGFSLCHSRMANVMGSQYSPRQSRFDNSALSPRFRENVLANNKFPVGRVVLDVSVSPSLDTPSVSDTSFYPSQNYQLTPRYNEVNLLQTLPFVSNGGPQAFTRGQSTNYGMTRHTHTKMYRSQPDQDSCQSPRMHSPYTVAPKCSSLAEAQGSIHHLAKDYHGCRFLQKLFDEGTPLDVHIIFNEIIDHVIDLMTNRFGNYLMQKLLEVCNEEQRMHILRKVTEEPGELVRISLNTHGTRVVQKLIETVETIQQISIVVSGLHRGFLSLAKDLNGNHVIQRCLERFTNEDIKSFFVAAAKHCVDIATHQHGCRVLLHCVDYSTGEYQATLVAAISENGLLLAQDAYGNYVVQYILELKNPRATSKLTSQFEGNYVNLSTQKFSSHVVEKCLKECNEEVRVKIIHELLSTTYFDQLLQDPHANYVIQKALDFSKGHLHNSLVYAIESCKAISRYSPFSKNIFSNKHLKK
ncbi:Translational repressor Pumilio/PUF3 and related RNA-binding proteins (Puf superfamily) [Handroanthus impetiginosus]|uniref:Translational repressor Pumilio/PUF3 and related RNA-binding proteins (Puf superfamily) n=1 Tax=Handroanthus impetiginosus TaxID=429701 RepID=A0A2G9GA15_9LAMI|nr:Translational repressor Pumilio/PUF3 and related RNA-binding proteins (Puf superfamily) [Handroanthus impetiginosus]